MKNKFVKTLNVFFNEQQKENSNINNILFESFQSQQELSKLADMILQKIIENSIDKTPIIGLSNCILSKITSLDFIALKRFIEESKVVVVFSDKYNFPKEDSKALYTVKRKTKFIYLRDNEFFIDVFNDYVSDNEQYNLLPLMQKQYKLPLIHELQHAFDDFRSNGKAFDLEIPNEVTPKNISDDELLLLKSEFNKKTANLKYEVDARFTQAIDKIKFATSDVPLTILPFNEVVKSFKINMKGYEVLSDEDKKRCLRKLGQFYEIIKSSLYKKW